MGRIKLLFWRFFGFPELPPKSDLTVMNQSRRVGVIVQMYLWGYDIATIAGHFGYTQTRVKAILWRQWHVQNLSHKRNTN